MTDRGLPEWAERARSQWLYNGSRRPPFAVIPAAGQESVWDYPRPPRLERDLRGVEVHYGPTLVARAPVVYRVLETASPPTVYLPPDTVRTDLLRPAKGGSLCEWKGEAQYLDVVRGDDALPAVAWRYPRPFPGFEAIAGYVSFYPARLDCRLGGERVAAQPGVFYGGWLTAELVGPFKGEPGSESW